MNSCHNDREAIAAAMHQFRELGGPEFVREMIELLRTQTPDQFRQIEVALANNDMVTAQRHAHSMKSSFGNFGATECRRLATAMDLAGKEGNADQFQTEYQKLKNAYQRFQPWLDEELSN